jgi:5-hydroxyisourate hydrolase
MSAASKPSDRLSNIASQFKRAPSSTMASARPPITCHVLDTTTGKPAPGIRVELELQSPTLSNQISLSAHTDGDGRVGQWQGQLETSGSSMETLFNSIEGDMTWKIRFLTAPYWAQKEIKPFFPEVEIKFTTAGFKGLSTEQQKPHWHVPLLLGPYTYTTYRGS